MVTEILKERQRQAELLIRQILKAETLEDLNELKKVTRFYLDEDRRIKEELRLMEQNS